MIPKAYKRARAPEPNVVYLTELRLKVRPGETRPKMTYKLMLVPERTYKWKHASSPVIDVKESAPRFQVERIYEDEPPC